jgi:hypothetical protein
LVIAINDRSDYGIDISRHLEVLLARKLLVLNNLDPVAIRVQQEGNVLHASVCKSLLPANVHILESLASSFKVIHRDTDVSKALGLAVTVMILEVLLLFGAVVPCQLKETLTVSDGVVILALREGLIARVAEEVEVEASLRVLQGAESRHAEDFLVVLQGLFGIFDTKHSVVHGVSSDICLLHVFGFLVIVSGNNFDPVTIGVKNEGNVAHTSIGKLLLELVTSILNSLAGGLDVVDRNTGVAEATVRLLVTVVDLVVGIILGSVVMSQLDETLSVKGALVVRQGLRRIIAEEVEVELVIGELELLDKAHSQELIEFSGGLGVLDSNHRVVELVVVSICGRSHGD